MDQRTEPPQPAEIDQLDPSEAVFATELMDLMFDTMRVRDRDNRPAMPARPRGRNRRAGRDERSRPGGLDVRRPCGRLASSHHGVLPPRHACRQRS